MNPDVKANASFPSPQEYFQQASTIKKTYSSAFTHFLILGTYMLSDRGENIKYLCLLAFNTTFNAQIEHNHNHLCPNTYILQHCS